MKMLTLVAVALAGIFLLGSVAFAQSGKGFDTSSALGELEKIGGLLLAMVFLGFLIVGGYVIIQALVDAKKQGGWGHFVVGIFMVLIAGFALWGLVSMSGQDPGTITRKLNIK